jgi:cell division protein FtsW
MFKEKQKAPLVIFILLNTIFIVLGFIFIYSSSSVYALEKFGSAHYFVKKQCIGCLLGLIGFLFAYCIPLTFIKKYTPLLFFSSLGLTALTLIPPFGQTINGSHRWIKWGRFSLQPSEFLKISFLLYLAYLLDKKQFKIKSLVYGYIPLLCVVSITSLILLKQPDFGQTVTLSITAFTLFFIAQCNIKHLAVTVSTVIPTGFILILLKPYRIKRVLTFLNPWADPQGSGFQIIQSLIAIGSGNISGVGIAQSKQKFFYLPMQHTDFIFSIIAEETGFIGSCTVISLFIAFLYYGVKVACLCTNNFCFYSIIGFVCLISLQALVNISVATGFVPTKGLGLPFISYGISALLCNISMLGFIVNCSKNLNKDI